MAQLLGVDGFVAVIGDWLLVSWCAIIRVVCDAIYRRLLMKRALFILILVVLAVSACTEADVASRNLSLAADQFKVMRRIVFYNGITGDYVLVIEGRCSLGNNDVPGELSVTCMVGNDEYVKHFLGLSDNVTYFAEQIETIDVDTYHYKVLFRPTEILPDVDIDVP